MLGILRFIGLVNAAAWLGAVLFFTLAVAPAFFQDTMLNLFGGVTAPYSRARTGLAAIYMMERYFVWLQICGVIAVLQALAESAYQGLSWKQTRNLLAMALLLLCLAGARGVHPILKKLHAARYDPRAKPEQVELAARSFRLWHGLSQGANLLLAGGLLFFFWKTANPRPRSLHTPPNPFQYRD